MKKREKFPDLRAFATALAALALAACGGGSGGEAGSDSANGAAPLPPTSDQLIAQAVASGDPSSLNSGHAPSLLAQATELAQKVHSQQTKQLDDILGTSAQGLNLTTSSVTVSPVNRLLATPLVVADSGAVLASVSRVGAGRAMAYGADVLSWMGGTSREQQHLPQFTRAFNWTITGQADGGLPATIRFAVGGYNAASVKAFVTRQGKAAQEVSCDIAAENTCWKDLDLLVFGSGVTNKSGLAARVGTYLAAGKPVVYMHPSWVVSDGGAQVLAGMGMKMGDYPGNYFAAANAVSVSADRTAAQTQSKATTLGPVIDTLKKLADDNLALDVTKDSGPTDAISLLHNDLAGLQSRGVAVFNTPDLELYRLLSLWADVVRPDIAYGKIDKAATPAKFLRTYASDSWLVFNRPHTTTAAAGQGDYMPAAAQQLAVSTDWEDIDVTIAQAGGVTLIGRGAVPAKGLQVQVVDAAGATSLGLKTSHLRAWGDPINDKNYPRPRRPHSFTVPMSIDGDALNFVTPFGGPLMLAYSGAKPGSVIKLQIKGAAKYSHFDFTRSMTEAELADGVAALKRGDFGWQTGKFVGGEIQQTIGYAQRAIGAHDPKTYMVDRVKSIIFDTNHIANGYINMPMATRVKSLCDQFGWNCADTSIHRAPGVQHFVGWIATCGFLCSGNPADGFTGIDIGWGWAHELGHNTVQRVMTIAPDGSGCTTECNNNILAGTQMLRKFALLGEDSNGGNFNHAQLYETIAASRATGLSGEPLRAEMQKRLWQMSMSNAMQAVHYQLAFAYTKHRLGLATPDANSAIEFMTLLTKGDRLVAKAWDTASAGKYAMGRYTSNTITNHELLYVLSSKIVGRDMRSVFSMYGLPLSDAALQSVADLNLPMAPLDFYALRSGKANQVTEGKWINLDNGTPTYPF